MRNDGEKMEKIFTMPADYDSLSEAEYIRIEKFHWESIPPYRPKTYFKMGVSQEGITAFLKCYESEPKAVYENRDDPVYKDSCLEFFVAPVPFKDEYINVECNSKGVFLCEFGKEKCNRRSVRDLTSLSPIVEPFHGDDGIGAYWGVKITLTKDFIAELFSVEKSKLNFDTVKANFYKCGDECEIPHYVAFAPVTSLPPGFHNPECFAIFEKGEKNNG